MAKAYRASTTDDETNYEYGEPIVWADSPAKAKQLVLPDYDGNVLYKEIRVHRVPKLDDREGISANGMILYYLNEQSVYNYGFTWNYHGKNVDIEQEVNYDTIYTFIHGDDYHAGYFLTTITEDDVDKFVENYMKENK